MAAAGDQQPFRFTPLKSWVCPTFWHKFTEIKIDFDGLSDAAKPIFGSYSASSSKLGYLEVDYVSFGDLSNAPKNCCVAFGKLYNKNTIEEFKLCDKNAVLQTEGKQFLDDVKTGKILEDPRLLAKFVILSFADLKTYNYYYWFAFPSPLKPNFVESLGEGPQFFAEQLHWEEYALMLNGFSDENRGFFVINISTKNKHTLKELIDSKNPETNFKDVDLNDIYFCFVDASDYDRPSWIMRNYAAFLYLTCPLLAGKNVPFLGVRGTEKEKYKASMIWKLKFPEFDKSYSEVQFIGWEPNKNNKMGPRMMSMKESMNPAELAETSINLNLKLMKWRLVPDLDLKKISDTKCLLFGAGTLGCAVARNLLGWGFKHITFVDNGKVSFSNPVRQYLYTHADAVVGDLMKATTAANKLKEINPNTNAVGYVMQIPMPGHTIGESMRQATIKDLEKIISLVQEHDVLFLLTDSRESRWLPTVLGAYYKKIVMNAALGFDSYLVMRHGNTKEGPNNSKYTDFGDLKCIPGYELGCYFCCDVTSPGNSLKDRTLDQQCTVTRPGVSNIAASYAVELLVSILQHPDRDGAPAYFCATGKPNSKVPEGLLGILPHSIRGMLFNYENILLATRKFNQCIACSEKIVEEYQDKGIEFLLKAFETQKYLVDLTGISELMKLDSAVIDCDDSDFQDSDE